jgi:opacity protein-like surface antigen
MNLTKEGMIEMRTRIFKKKRSRRPAVVLAVLLVVLLVPAAGAQAAAPANDDFGSAVGITALPYSDVRLTNEATSDPADPNCFGGGRTVWYSFTPTEAGRVSVDTLESNYDTTLGIYTGTKGSLTEIACSDNFGYGKKSLVRFDAQAGTTYQVMVGSLTTGKRGTLRLNATTAPPKATNDDEPIEISTLPLSETVDVTEATASPTDPNCYESARTVWYSYTPAQDIRLGVDTSESNWDTVVGIYEGEKLTRIVCTDNPVARFNAEAGKTYRVMIGTYRTSPALDLVVTLDEAPPPLEVDARIAAKGRVASMTGTARFKVGLRCSDDARAFASGLVKQRQGDVIVTASFNKRLRCSTDWTEARMSAVPYERAFQAGKAIVTLKVRAYSSDERSRQSTRRVVRFK